MEMPENFNLIEFAKSNEIIFYGAGLYIKLYIGNFTANGIFPVCFADRDESKHGSFIGKTKILSPEEAFSTYPNAYVLFTVEPLSAERIIEAVIKSGTVPRERVLNLRFKKIRSCGSVNNQIWLERDKLGLCCAGTALHKPFVPFDKNDIEGSIDTLLRLREKQSELLENGCESGFCKGCSLICENNWVSTDGKINSIILGGSAPCNAKCYYCARTTPASEDIPAVINALENKMLISPGAYFCIAPGEITVHPDRKQILEIGERYNSQILTNALIYNKTVSKIIAREHSLAIISLDAGTRDGYKLVKGIDVFDKVVENLKQYKSDGAHIELKYIICTGYNDNFAEADGFINLCREIMPESVVLSYNLCEGNNVFSDKNKEILLRINNGIKRAGIAVSYYGSALVRELGQW
jgi:sulfatase maturation enzyme AslB (radical SAM superfamily)